MPSRQLLKTLLTLFEDGQTCSQELLDIDKLNWQVRLGWVSSYRKYYPLYLYLASWNLRDSQLSCESEVEPSLVKKNNFDGFYTNEFNLVHIYLCTEQRHPA